MKGGHFIFHTTPRSFESSLEKKETTASKTSLYSYQSWQSVSKMKNKANFASQTLLFIHGKKNRKVSQKIENIINKIIYRKTFFLNEIFGK